MRQEKQKSLHKRVQGIPDNKLNRWSKANPFNSGSIPVLSTPAGFSTLLTPKSIFDNSEYLFRELKG